MIHFCHKRATRIPNGFVHVTIALTLDDRILHVTFTFHIAYGISQLPKGDEDFQGLGPDGLKLEWYRTSENAYGAFISTS